MTDRELMQMALDALEWCYDVTEWPANGKSAQDKAIEALRARLAQPEPEELGEVIPADEEQLKRIAKLIEPEPVAWMHDSHVGFNVPLYTAPPQREWQGLTDEEITETLKRFGLGERAALARAIEAKLKEKNND